MISMTDRTLIFTYSNDSSINILKNYLADNQYEIITISSIKMLFQKSRQYMPACILIYLPTKKSSLTEWSRFKKRFPMLPCIVIIASSDIELAYHCGILGIDFVMSLNELPHIDKNIRRICMKKNSKVFLSELNINKANPAYPTWLKEALLYIENNYIKILNTTAIADTIEISECTLSREFAKYSLPGPKKLLTFLKVKQATKLMYNRGLNLQEIAYLSGFTDEKRMGECFKRMFGIPPGEYRKKLSDL